MKKISKETLTIVCVALVFYIAGVLEVKYWDSKDTITATELVSDYVNEEYGVYNCIEINGIERDSDYRGDWKIDYRAIIGYGEDQKIYDSTTSVDHMLAKTGNEDKRISFKWYSK